MTTPTRLMRILANASWAFGTWLLLTWTATAEQLMFGGVLALFVGVALAPLGPVVGPWRLLAPMRLLAVLRLAGYVVVNIVRANVELAIRILRPSRPLSAGMVIVPTAVRTDGELCATGLITSLIVDNQIVDLNRRAQVLQYHAVRVPERDPGEEINLPAERLIAKVRRPR